MDKTPSPNQLKFRKKYKTYQDFYDENQKKIFETIVNLFDQFKENDTTQLDLMILANIDNLKWDTTFNFKKEESFILKRDLLPFFENNEDYEMCAHIKKLEKELMLLE